MLRYVNTESGVIEGYFGYDPRITVFKGVPYACPPVGELRWKEPQPMPHWDGVRPAFKYGPISYQWTPGADPSDFWSRELHPSGPDYDMSEDCLYVNIFTPAKSADEKLPVLFYIHGGGYQGGYPYEVEFDWERVARHGVVVVAVTYRLGVFGFLAHPELTAENPDGVHGNMGILDQLAGLRWTHDNIAAFGGDPDKITIAGQSAGAGSVQCLITSPMAEGLIAGAIIQSAVTVNFGDVGAGFLSSGSLEKAEETGVEFFKLAGVETLEEARKLSSKEVFDAAVKGKFGFRFAPVVDGKLIVEPAFPRYLHNKHHNIPILTGFNRGESRGFMRWGKSPKTLAEFDEYAHRFGGLEPEFRRVADVKTDKDVEELFLSDAFVGMLAGAYLFGTLQSRQGRKTYLYEFDASIPGEDNPGSFHGSEMWFAFDSVGRSWRPFRGVHYDLAREVSSYWTNFVKYGDPNGVDSYGEPLPEWKPFDEDEEFMLEIADKTEKRSGGIDPVMKLRIEYSLRDIVK